MEMYFLTVGEKARMEEKGCAKLLSANFCYTHGFNSTRVNPAPNQGSLPVYPEQSSLSYTSPTHLTSLRASDVPDDTETIDYLAVLVS